MEQITYRKTLDVHKNGIQFLLQGFETADILSRVIEISLMASGDAIDFPLERVVAMMYVTTPNATEPSINSCAIKDNKIVYNVLPIVEEGITTMQIKIIETSPDGATSVIAAPKFAVEVTKSGADDGSAEQTTTFTALEDAVAKAKTVYDERFLRMELTNDCVFKAYYADGTEYETDILKKLFHNGNVLLSESYAHGGTGVRSGEDTDNSLYYSNVSKSEALNAKNIMANSEEILEEVKLQGVYTAFSVNFETGEVEYVSPSFKFNVNIETGELDAIGQSYSFEDEMFRVVEDWLAEHGVVLSDLQAIASKHSAEILELQETSQTHSENIESISEDIESMKEQMDASGKELEEVKKSHDWNIDGNLGRINANSASVTVLAGYGAVKTNSIDIIMINSGQVYLTFEYRANLAYTNHFFNSANCYVKRGDEILYSVNHEDLSNAYNETVKIPLTVTKGDIITIEVSSLGMDSKEEDNIIAENINLYANVATAYKYVDLVDLVDEEFTLEDVVTALVGE